MSLAINVPGAIDGPRNRHFILAPSMLGLILAGACVQTACPEDEPAPEPIPAQPDPAAGFLPFGHAHNDYKHDSPLFDALSRGLYSVEADVYPGDGRVIVKHLAIERSRGTLEDLYLDPLSRIVAERGSVHGDGVPFHLWIDLKDSSRELQDALTALLVRYSQMLSPRSDGSGRAPPVIVVFTGNAESKSALAERPALHPSARDSNDFSLSDPPADASWRYYALRWGDYILWDGRGIAPAEARRQLTCLARAAHDGGRKIRLWSSPATEAAWQLQLDVGIDFLNADDLDRLSSFLRARAPVVAAAGLP